MRRCLRGLAVFCVALGALAPTLVAADKPAPIPFTIETTALGDSADGVVTRISFHYQLPGDLETGISVFVQGSILQNGDVVKNFRDPIRPNELQGMDIVQTLPEGSLSIEARVLGERGDGLPLIFAKTTMPFTVKKTGKEYVAKETAPADAIVATPASAEKVGAVKIEPPRRELAPNLFTVDVDVEPPVQRVEFWVNDKKVMTKNAPPYEAELDLGSIPRQVEVRAIGYDRAGRYVDADAWVVNEHETPLEVKITRTVTPDGINHIKLSIQNPKDVDLKKVELFLGDRNLRSWSEPPYAVDLPASALQGGSYLRASAVGADGYEASDLLYLNGNRYTEKLEVNLVELPVTVLDEKGSPVSDLKKDDFRVSENGKPQKISTFAFANDLPLSVGVLVDHSGSMEKRLDEAKKAALGFFRHILRPGDRGFFGGFAWEPSKLTPLISDIDTLEAEVDAMPPARGGTALYDAIVTGLYRFRGVEGRKALVVVTDGVDTVSRVPYDDMLKYVRVARVPIYFIGVGISRLDFKASGTLKNLAAETGAVAYFIRKIDQLPDTYAEIERELRSQYILSYYTEASSKDHKYRTVEVTVSRPDLKVRTIRGFIP